MNTGLKKLAIGTSTVLLALGAAACGSDSAPRAASSAADVRPAADISADLQPAELFGKIAAAQADAGTSHVALTIAGDGQTVTAEGDVALGDSLADSSVSMTLDLASVGLGSMSMILVDQDLYLNLGGMSGGKFAKIALDDTSNPVGRRLASLTGQLDPRRLDQLQQAVTSLRTAGAPETIDGVQAQPYELTVDTTKIPGIDDVPATAKIPTSLTITFYVGPDDLLRRVTTAAAGSTLTADFTSWGAAVDVQAPPADQVTEGALPGLS